eukprot:4020838-Ditylum_brightwellii.AAC.1
MHEHNNSGSGAAASAAILSQRGVLPEVIVVDDEEDKDVKILAEGKEEEIQKKIQWSHPDNWKRLEEA